MGDPVAQQRQHFLFGLEIGLQLLDDLQRLRQKGTIACTEVPRRLVSKKGGIQSVSLLDVSTLEATFGRDAGSLVPQPAKIRNLA